MGICVCVCMQHRTVHTRLTPGSHFQQIRKTPRPARQPTTTKNPTMTVRQTRKTPKNLKMNKLNTKFVMQNQIFLYFSK
jgi:hypothetical protein